MTLIYFIFFSVTIRAICGFFGRRLTLINTDFFLFHFCMNSHL